MSIFKAGASPTTIYAWEGGQRVISRVYVWAAGSQHTVWDQSLDASVGPPKPAATALALPPGVTSSPPVVTVPGAAVTSSALARPPAVTATSSVHVIAPAAAAGTGGISPAVSADAVLIVEEATAGAIAIPTINDVLLLPAAAASTAVAHSPGVDFGGNAFVSPPRASATAAGIVPIVAANMAITVPVVTATGSGTVPSPDNATPIPAATATGSAAAPGISKGVPAVAATATAAGIVPAVTSSSLILPPAATAAAAGIVPQVISSINATVTVPAAASTTSALASPPGVTVTVIDLFNRSNNTALGSDWTETVVSGSGLGINSNALTWQGSTDGFAYALHNTPMITDAFDITITPSSVSSSRDSRIIGGCNSGATVFAGLNWYTNALYLVKCTGSYTSTTDMTSQTSGVTVSTSTPIRFRRVLVSGHYTYYVDVNGVNKITFADTTDQVVVGASNRRVGCGLEWASFSASGGFNDFTATG